MYRKYSILALLGALSISLSAQQESMQTQFMYNKLAFNPGYAGSFIAPTISVINRNQWVGVEGAPNTQALSYSQPFLSNRLGVGLNLVRNTITINRGITAELSYAYQLPVFHGYLGMGIQASMRHLRQNWQDERVITSQPRDLDNAIPANAESKLVANFGFGLFYDSKEGWYAGISSPRLVRNNIGLGENQGTLTKEVRHINAMAGIDFWAGEGVKLTPQILFRYAKNAPPDLDVNLSAAFQSKFMTGLTYRTGGDAKNLGESIDVLAGIQATKNLFIMLSYDIGLTRLKQFSNGSIEATARWWINPPEGTEVDDPNRPK
jgi:type IX secretion system PorP/SprF family membrane protein